MYSSIKVDLSSILFCDPVKHFQNLPLPSTCTFLGTKSEILFSCPLPAYKIRHAYFQTPLVMVFHISQNGVSNFTGNVEKVTGTVETVTVSCITFTGDIKKLQVLSCGLHVVTYRKVLYACMLKIIGNY